ncbi:MAG: hypothetical protein FWD69_14810 [Polyangiaceae bacterium]|nr:hypothetical protein [Polyangiaceae bacterium]
MTIQRGVHLYTECGLNNVILYGVEIRTCTHCGAKEVPLPNAVGLHRCIARAIVCKRARLSGSEVRFLRTYLGWSGVDFSEHIGVTASTVSNWENDKEPIGTSSDRLLRMMVVFESQVQDYTLEDLKRIEPVVPAAWEIKLHPGRKGDWGLEAQPT